MSQIYYHISSNRHSEYSTSLEEAKNIAERWKNEGDSNIQISKTKKNEDGDTIFLDEEKTPLTESLKS